MLVQDGSDKLKDTDRALVKIMILSIEVRCGKGTRMCARPYLFSPLNVLYVSSSHIVEVWRASISWCIVGICPFQSFDDGYRLILAFRTVTMAVSSTISIHNASPRTVPYRTLLS